MVGRSEGEPDGDDEQLLVAARTDPDAFVRFYDLRYGGVTAYFYRRTLCPHTTAELTAETFARVWATRARFDPAKGSAVGWTMGVARNLYRQWCRDGVVSATVRTRLSMETPTLGLEDLEHIERLVDMAELRRQL